jgi:hypothetical protein
MPPSRSIGGCRSSSRLSTSWSARSNSARSVEALGAAVPVGDREECESAGRHARECEAPILLPWLPQRHAIKTTAHKENEEFGGDGGEDGVFVEGVGGSRGDGDGGEEDELGEFIGTSGRGLL